MKKNAFKFTSQSFQGEIIFVYNGDGYLLQYDATEAQLNTAQLIWITVNLPRMLSDWPEILKVTKGAKLLPFNPVTWTFEMFWFVRSGDKPRPRWPRNSSKKKTATKWNKMAQSERDKAGNYFETYQRNIPPGVAMMYAESYLNAELWNN